MVDLERGDLRLPTALARATNTPCCEHSTGSRTLPTPKTKPLPRGTSTASTTSPKTTDETSPQSPQSPQSQDARRLPLSPTRNRSLYATLRPQRNDFLAETPHSASYEAVAGPQHPTTSSPRSASCELKPGPKTQQLPRGTSTRSASSNNFLAGHAQLPVKLSPGPKTQLPRGPHPHSAS